MKQKIEQLGFIDDKIYDWMLLDQPDIMDDLEMNFDVIPNEAEFLKQIREELKQREKVEEEKQKEKEKKTIASFGAKSPRSRMGSG